MSSEDLVLLGSIGRSQTLTDAIGRIAESEELDRHDSEKSCWSRNLEGLDTAGRLGLEGLLLTHVSQLIF